MIPNFSMRYVVVATALTLTLTGALTLTGGASAQSVEGNVSANGSAGSPTANETIAGTVGPIEIESYGLENGTMVLTLDVSEPTPYALSDGLAGTRSSGVTTIPTKDGVLNSGRQTITMNVSIVNGAAAVTLATPEAAVRIQQGTVSLGGSEPTIRQSTARMLIIGTAIASGGAIGGIVRRKQQEEKEDYERIL